MLASEPGKITDAFTHRDYLYLGDLADDLNI
jgi:hypothetical protein